MVWLRLDLIAGEAHLTRPDKTEAFIKRPAGFRSVQDKAVEPLGPRPVK